jgi:Cu2+-exporting ATPase
MHPVARAFCAAFAQAGDRPLRPTDIVQDLKGGISGSVAGRRLVIGSPAFVARQCRLVGKLWHHPLRECLRQGLTPVLVAEGNTVLAVAGFGDTVRPDAADALMRLQKQGWELGILSGDHPDVVWRVADQLNIPQNRAFGGLLPEDKLAHVRAAMQHRPVVMVGDGVNDAAALAAATVGIAVHGGAEASLSAASIYLNKPGLSAIADVASAARSTVKVIRRSIIASISYNALAITLAAVGWINPLVAAILMPVSSLTVISLALGVRTFSTREREV